jgi:hypothetical protein
LHHNTEALSLVKQIENSEFQFVTKERDDIQVQNIFAKRQITSQSVLFADPLQVEGTISYIVSSYDKDGKMNIEAVLIANSYEKIAINLLTLENSVLFVDHHLIEFLPLAYISRSSLI